MGTFWMSRSASARRVRISRALAVSKVPVLKTYTLWLWAEIPHVFRR